jgi:hypothetical protein
MLIKSTDFLVLAILTKVAGFHNRLRTVGSLLLHISYSFSVFSSWLIILSGNHLVNACWIFNCSHCGSHWPTPKRVQLVATNNFGCANSRTANFRRNSVLELLISVSVIWKLRACLSPKSSCVSLWARRQPISILLSAIAGRSLLFHLLWRLASFESIRYFPIARCLLHSISHISCYWLANIITLTTSINFLLSLVAIICRPCRATSFLYCTCLLSYLLLLLLNDWLVTLIKLLVIWLVTFLLYVLISCLLIKLELLWVLLFYYSLNLGRLHKKVIYIVIICNVSDVWNLIL